MFQVQPADVMGIRVAFSRRASFPLDAIAHRECPTEGLYREIRSLEEESRQGHENRAQLGAERSSGRDPSAWRLVRSVRIAKPTAA
jgi:hypothetical protein